MSITDELRKYVQDWRETPNLMDDLDAGDVDGILADFESIADRIDAEHEKVMSRAGQLLDDAEKERNYNYANWQDCKQKVLQGNITFDILNARIERLEDELSRCIEMPKDADGVPICVGDVLTDNAEFKSEGKVGRLMLVNGGWMVGFDGCAGWADASTHEWHHYHKSTVEDLIRDAILRCVGLLPEYWDELIAECAAKLRLAGDGEEQ